MSAKVLLVDDEPNVLQGFKRHLRGTHDIALAVGGAEAIELIQNEGPFAVVVSDMQMPSMSGSELLAKVRELHEHTVRIMLTGNADQATAAKAVNDSHVFRFLSKPCSPTELATALDAAIQHYQIVTAEAELLSKTLSGSVRMLTQVLSMTLPEAFGQSQEARTLAAAVASRMEVGPAWQVELAAMLMRIGCVSLPDDVLERYLSAEPMSPSELELIESTATVGGGLIASVPRLEGVAGIVRNQFASPTDSVDQASLILRAVGDFQRRRGDGSPLDALRQMTDARTYDLNIVELLTEVVQDLYQSRELKVTELKQGMILEANVEDTTGRMLVTRGTEIHESLIQKLMTIRRQGVGVKEPIQVRLIESTRKTRAEPETIAVAG